MTEENAPAGEGSADAGPGSGDGPEPEGRESKGSVADSERSHRVYRETYGRGGGDRFSAAGYPHSYAVPGSMDWRRALRAYVNGHDRGWEADRKYEVAAEEKPGGSPARTEEPERHDAPDAGGREAAEATGATEEGGRFGVGIPDREELAFHRGPSTWRDRLPDARRLPRHTDRSLDGRRGEGEQA